MKLFYVIEDVSGRRVYFNGMEMSDKLCGGELTGGPFTPDTSFTYVNPLGNLFTVTFDI